MFPQSPPGGQKGSWLSPSVIRGEDEAERSRAAQSAERVGWMRSRLHFRKCIKSFSNICWNKFAAVQYFFLTSNTCNSETDTYVMRKAETKGHIPDANTVLALHYHRQSNHILKSSSSQSSLHTLRQAFHYCCLLIYSPENNEKAFLIQVLSNYTLLFCSWNTNLWYCSPQTTIFSK